MLNKIIKLVEVGPRDGLQNEKSTVSTADKIILTDLLSETGFMLIEATSFVSPKWVPQLADASEVMAGITRADNVRYIALTPNIQGFERARAAGVDEIAVFAAASETFSQKNINCTIEESLNRFIPVINAAKAEGIAVRGYISTVVHCPYEGAIAPEPVLPIAEQLLEMGCYEISLGDTTGQGTPQTVSALLSHLTKALPAALLAGHFHDTNHQAVANVMTSLDFGLRCFDSAVSGLGGCPYAPGAKGNVSTRAVAEALHKEGWQTDLDMAKLTQAESHITSLNLLQAHSS
jgi:hydroxymethylglutaryl-CoA lyase